MRRRSLMLLQSKPGASIKLPCWRREACAMYSGEIETTVFLNMLQRLGFVQNSMSRHALFRHPGTGMVATVPTSQKRLRPIIARTIMKQIEYYGIATEKQMQLILSGRG